MDGIGIHQIHFPKMRIERFAVETVSRPLFYFYWQGLHYLLLKLLVYASGLSQNYKKRKQCIPFDSNANVTARIRRVRYEYFSVSVVQMWRPATAKIHRRYNMKKRNVILEISDMKLYETARSSSPCWAFKERIRTQKKREKKSKLKYTPNLVVRHVGVLSLRAST